MKTKYLFPVTGFILAVLLVFSCASSPGKKGSSKSKTSSSNYNSSTRGMNGFSYEKDETGSMSKSGYYYDNTSKTWKKVDLNMVVKTTAEVGAGVTITAPYLLLLLKKLLFRMK